MPYIGSEDTVELELAEDQQSIKALTPDAAAPDATLSATAVVRGSIGPRVTRRPETAGFVEEQRSRPALPLLVFRERLVRAVRDDRIQA
jgi:hypothetical protein